MLEFPPLVLLCNFHLDLIHKVLQFKFKHLVITKKKKREREREKVDINSIKCHGNNPCCLTLRPILKPNGVARLLNKRVDEDRL